MIKSVAAYVALAYAISWTLWAPAVISHYGWIGHVPSRALHLAGGLGPMLAAITITGMTGGRPALKRMGERCLTGRSWLLIAILVLSALFLASAAVIGLFYGERIQWSNVGRGGELADLPRPVYWLSSLVFYGFGEEVGWRGFALPRLQARTSALSASLLLALAWAGWHLPLFAFSPGLSSLNPASIGGWFVSLCLGSILLTWLFNSSGGSIAAVALFHAVLDILFASPVATALPNVMGAVLSVGTLLLIPVFGRANLARRPRVIEPVARSVHVPQEF